MNVIDMLQILAGLLILPFYALHSIIRDQTLQASSRRPHRTEQMVEKALMVSHGGRRAVSAEHVRVLVHLIRTRITHNHKARHVLALLHSPIPLTLHPHLLRHQRQ